MRSMHFTWMDLVRLVARGVSLVIYTFIENRYHRCFFKLNIEPKITFNNISI